MSARTPEVVSTAPPSFAEMGKSVLGALIAFVPRALAKTFLGAAGGFFVCGLLGVVTAGIGSLFMRHGSAPAWLAYLNLVWVPAVFAIAGGYVGGANGFLSTLADETRRRGLGVRLFALMKPAFAFASSKIRARAGSRAVRRAELVTEVRGALSKHISDADAGETGGGFERFLARRSRKILCLTFARTLITSRDPADALDRMETLGAKHTEDMLLEIIEDFFQGQMMLAVLAGLAAALAPTLVGLLVR